MWGISCVRLVGYRCESCLEARPNTIKITNTPLTGPCIKAGNHRYGLGGEGREVVEEGEGAEGVERLVGLIEVGVVNLVRRGQSNSIEFILYLAV